MRDIQAHVAAKENSVCDMQTGKDVQTLSEQMEPIRFACPVCGDTFETRKEAKKCRDQPFDDGGLTVGTIVVVPDVWSSVYPSESPWVAFEVPADPDSDDHFDHVVQRTPYFVVTAIHGHKDRPHECVVTLATLVDDELCIGWNPATGAGHCSMFRIDGGKHCDVDIDLTYLETIKPYLANCNPSSQMREEAARLARLGISTGELL